MLNDLKPMKAYFVFGTKAELIKSAGILMEMSRRKIDYEIIHTGQHAKIEKELETFNLPIPSYRITRRIRNLKSIPEMSYWFISAFFRGLFLWAPAKRGLVLVHGDTESTLLAALLARLKGCKLAHIEGGLRSNDLIGPFPEEIVRRITDFLSHYIFVPNSWAESNLKRRRGRKIFNTFLNPSYDSLRYILKCKPKIKIPKEKFAIVLLHRKENIYIRENLDKSMKIILEVAKKNKTLFVLAKNTEHTLKRRGYFTVLKKNQNIVFRDYYDYRDFVHLVNSAEFIVTDGGSIQEEAYLLNKPILLLRKKTERIEGLNETACLSKLDFDKAVNFIYNYKSFRRKREVPGFSPSEKVCKEIQEILK